MTLSQEYHVTSFVCQAVPSQLEAAKNKILSLDNAEVHGDDTNGKFIFTLEGPTQSSISQRVEQLRTVPCILTLAPVYHQYINE